MKKHLLLVMILFCLGFKAESFADNMSEERISVSPSIGQMQYDLPLYMISDPDFKWPIMLSYTSDGFKPYDYSYPVGYGWNIIGGGMISRQIIDINDDMNFPSDGYNNAGFLAYARNDVNRTFAYGARDFGSDVYSFSFGEYSGQFIVTGSNDTKILSGDFVNIDISRFVLQPNAAYHDTTYVPQASMIIITTLDGYKYFFGGTAEKLEFVGGANRDDWNPIITTWQLSKIEAPNNNCLLFHYHTRTPEHPLKRKEEKAEWGSLSSAYSKLGTVSDTLDLSARKSCTLYVSSQKCIFTLLDSITNPTTGLKIDFQYEWNENIIDFGQHHPTRKYGPLPFLSMVRASVRSEELFSWFISYQMHSCCGQSYYFLTGLTNSANQNYSYTYSISADFPEISAFDDIDMYGYNKSHPEYGEMLSSTNPLGGITRFEYADAHHDSVQVCVKEDSTWCQTPMRLVKNICRSRNIREISVISNNNTILTKKYYYRVLPPGLDIQYPNQSIGYSSGTLSFGVLLRESGASLLYKMVPFQHLRRGERYIHYSSVWENIYDESNSLTQQTQYLYRMANQPFAITPAQYSAYEYLVDIEPYLSKRYNIYYPEDKKIYTSSFALKKEHHYEYLQSESNNSVLKYNNCLWSAIPSSTYHTSAISDIRYESNGTIEKTTYLVYDGYSRITKKTEIQGQDTTFTQYRYRSASVPTDLEVPPMWNESVKASFYLSRRGIAEQPYETTTGYVKNGQEYVTSGKLSLWNISTYSPNSSALNNVCRIDLSLQIGEPISDYCPSNASGTEYQYDPRYEVSVVRYYQKWSRLVQEQSHDAVLPTQYTWGTDDLMPVTKSIGNKIWRFTYKPYVGILSETDPRGQIIYYKYDFCGRLQQKYRLNGNTKEIISYYLYR